MKKKTCVIVGGAGFIGSAIARELSKQGAFIKIVDDLSSGDMKKIPEGVAFYKLDISLPQAVTALEAIFTGADYVFHLAAKLSVPESIQDPVLYHKTNIDGMQNVVEAAKAAGVHKVIFSSSSAVYGDIEKSPTTEADKVQPKSPYALHKAYGEQLLKLYSELYNLKSVSLRYFNVYGPGHRDKGAYAPVVALFVKQFYDNVPLTVCGDGKQTRDFIHIHDVVRANIAAAMADTDGAEVFNIGSGQDTSVLRLAEMFGAEVTHVEARLEPKFSKADITKAAELLNWSPTISIEEGVGDFLRYPKLRFDIDTKLYV